MIEDHPDQDQLLGLREQWDHYLYTLHQFLCNVDGMNHRETSSGHGILSGVSSSLEPPYHTSNSSRSPMSSVLDLPQLHTHPSASTLLQTLTKLTLAPTSWDAPSVPKPGHRSSHDDLSSLPPNEVASYLTRIISSTLSWIPDEGSREEIWECASRRLSERAGRSGLSSLLPRPQYTSS